MEHAEIDGTSVGSDDGTVQLEHVPAMPLSIEVPRKTPSPPKGPKSAASPQSPQSPESTGSALAPPSPSPLRRTFTGRGEPPKNMLLSSYNVRQLRLSNTVTGVTAFAPLGITAFPENAAAPRPTTAPETLADRRGQGDRWEKLAKRVPPTYGEWADEGWVCQCKSPEEKEQVWLSLGHTQPARDRKLSAPEHKEVKRTSAAEKAVILARKTSELECELCGCKIPRPRGALFWETTDATVQKNRWEPKSAEEIAEDNARLLREEKMVLLRPTTCMSEVDAAVRQRDEEKEKLEIDNWGFADTTAVKKPAMSFGTAAMVARVVGRPAAQRRLAQERAPPRPRCQYGIKCYRHSAEHKAEYSHPGDADWPRCERVPLSPAASSVSSPGRGRRGRLFSPGRVKVKRRANAWATLPRPAGMRELSMSTVSTATAIAQEKAARKRAQ